MKEISSTSNPYIKKIIAWQEKSKLRKADNVFVIDGWKETKMALENGFVVETILCSASIMHSSTFSDLESSLKQLQSKAEIIRVSDVVFDKISIRGNTSKVVAIAQQKTHLLSQITLSKNPIEKKCADNEIICEWKPNDGLRMINKNAGIKTHPITHEKVWFNHTQVFHVSAAADEYHRINKRQKRWETFKWSILLEMMTWYKKWTNANWLILLMKPIYGKVMQQKYFLFCCK